MTMKAFREEISRKTSPNALYTSENLVNFYREISRVIETLWKNGYVTEFSTDILREANGFVNCGGDLRIMQTLDLHSITADKKATKLFAEYLLG